MRPDAGVRVPVALVSPAKEAGAPGPTARTGRPAPCPWKGRWGEKPQTHLPSVNTVAEGSTTWQQDRPPPPPRTSLSSVTRSCSVMRGSLSPESPLPKVLTLGPGPLGLTPTQLLGVQVQAGPCALPTSGVGGHVGHFLEGVQEGHSSQHGGPGEMGGGRSVGGGLAPHPLPNWGTLTSAGNAASWPWS